MILISIIIVILTVLCTSMGTYAVIINVVNDNGKDKIINNISIRDLLTNDMVLIIILIIKLKMN